MNLKLILGLVFASVVLFGLGFGLFYWFYIRTRTKKITYNARVWEKIGSLTDYESKDKKEIKPIPLGALKPYCRDVVERVELGHNQTVFRLVKLNKPVGEVKAEHINYWGKDNMEVNILKFGDNFLLMRAGVDENHQMVFQPMEYDLANMLLNQIAVKEEKFRKEKDIFAAVTPWIMMGILIIGIVMTGYFVGQGWVTTSENNIKAAELNKQANKDISDKLVEVAKLVSSQNIVSVNTQQKLGVTS